VSGYVSQVELEPAERERLATAIGTRPLVFNAWAFATGREALPVVTEKLPTLRARAEKIAGRAPACLRRAAVTAELTAAGSR
jgi:hypothetical protein